MIRREERSADFFKTFKRRVGADYELFLKEITLVYEGKLTITFNLTS